MQDEPVSVDAWGYLLRIHAELTSRIEADLEAQGHISLTWYDVLLVLDNAPEKQLRMNEIAEKIVLSRSALSRSAAKLVEEGYIKKETCPEDERGAFAVLTKKGQQALAQARPVYWAGIQKYFAAGLTEGEINQLVSTFEKVMKRFQQQPWVSD
ncbi:MAG: transcriptional regulator, MarR family [Verrucomicrobiales bacterium]|nr:transcriptional regulator, MarR family [Verrucomicrobiales bacterium]